jgi:hypothetical protein
MGLKALEKFKDTKLNGQQVRAQIRWRDHGDACKKEFFQTIKPRHARTKITKLELIQGGSTIDPEEMCRTCHKFYNNLYSA